MLSRIGVEDNFRSQILEVHKQLKRINTYLREPSPADLEKKLPPPFSVLGHGDFNADNVIFDPERAECRIRGLSCPVTPDGGGASSMTRAARGAQVDIFESLMSEPAIQAARITR